MEFFKKYQGQLIGVGIAVVVIGVGILITNSQNRSVNQAVNEMAIASSTQLLDASAIDSVQLGADTYAIGGVSWVFTNVDGGNQLRIKLNGFTQNAVPVAVAPYRLGTYAGDCLETGAPQDVVVASANKLIGFAQCSDAAHVRQFAVYAEGNLVVVESRLITQNTIQPFEQILMIDIAHLPALLK